MFVLIFLSLLGVSAYYFFGAVWVLVCTMPLLLAIPFIALNDICGWILYRKKRAASKRRLQAWWADIEKGIREHEERFPEEGDLDENGIPYL